MSLRGRAAAIGIAEMAPCKDMGGWTPLAIIAGMAREAIADAGLEPDDIDGLLTGVPVGDTGMLYPASVVEYLGLRARYLDVVDIGGASAAGMLWRAAAAIDAGLCSTVLCVCGDTFGRVEGSRWPTISLTREFEVPYGTMAANTGYALIAQRHMHQYGTTPAQLAKIAVDQRTNALQNPQALFGDTPITVDDVLGSPLIVDPLHLLESSRAPAAPRSSWPARRGRGGHRIPPSICSAPASCARMPASPRRPTSPPRRSRRPPRRRSPWPDCRRATCTSLSRTIATRSPCA